MCYSYSHALATPIICFHGDALASHRGGAARIETTALSKAMAAVRERGLSCLLLVTLVSLLSLSVAQDLPGKCYFPLAEIGLSIHFCWLCVNILD